MPPGDEDVTTSLDSSASETTPPDTQVPAHTEAPPPESGADADQQSNEVASETPPENPDPVQEAIARLAKPVSAPKATKPDIQSKDQSAPTAKSEPAPERVAEAKPKVGPTLDDPYAGWLPSEQARNLLKPQTKQRIEDLHHRWKESENHPARALGNEFQGMLDTHNLNDDIGFVQPDHLAGLVRAQAAVNRGLLSLEQGRRPAGTDVQAVQALAQQVDQIREKFGLAPNVTPATDIQPFQGDLPPEYQNLVDIFNLPEARVRLLAAIEQSSAVKQPPVRAEAPAAAPQADNRPEGVDMEALHARRMHGVFARDGISADRFAVHQQVLEPIMQRLVSSEFPGYSKDQIIRIFNAMSAKERVDIAVKAHAEYRAGKEVPPTAPRSPKLPPTTRPTLQGTPGREPPKSKGDALDSAIAFLSRPASE